MLDCMKERRCCTYQKTEYRTAQAATRVVKVFMVEVMRGSIHWVLVLKLLLRSWSWVVVGLQRVLN